MAEPENLTDEMIAGRRPTHHRLPPDMAGWMRGTIVVVDTFNYWVGRVVALLVVPLMAAMVYEVVARYAMTPTLWAYDITRMIYGAMFVLGAAYALSRGVHIRSDFLYRKWSVKTQGRIDATLYIVCFFPAMIVLLYVSGEWAWLSLTRAERGTDTAWMPLLGPVKSTLPIGVAFLILQGVSEVLKSLYAARKGEWPQ